MNATLIVPTVEGRERLLRLLSSIDGEHETIVVANGSRDGAAAAVRTGFGDVEVLELPENVGYARAVNLAARHASGRAIVLVNDDCVLQPRFVDEIVRPLDASSGIVMAAGVLTERRDPSLVDTAGMALDETLLALDYLNGEAAATIDESTPPPIGPCGAAAAFDRDAFLDVGGFDEAFFAYWEDVDLVLRLRLAGGTCALAPAARGTHEHSATLGSGSARKNELTGWGRGYVLRRWSVLRGRRVAKVIARDGLICLGQALADRNTAGLRGRIRGYRAAASVPRRAYPARVLADRDERGTARSLATRGRRRRRIASAA